MGIQAAKGKKSYSTCRAQLEDVPGEGCIVALSQEETLKIRINFPVLQTGKLSRRDSLFSSKVYARIWVMACHLNSRHING